MSTKLKFLIGEKKLNATKWGANILEPDISKLASWVPAVKEMGLQAVHWNNLTGTVNDTIALILNSFLTNTGVELSIHYPVENKTIQKEFPKYLDDLQRRFKIALLQLSNESLSTPEGMTNTEYIVESHKIISHVFSTPCSWDLGLLYRYPNALHEARNEAIAKEPAPPDEGRQYAQGVDILKAMLKKGFTSDQTANVELIKTLTTELLPQLLEDYHNELPNLKKQNVLQTFLENAGENFLSDAVSNYGYGEYFRFFLTNTESFARVFWMSLGRHITKDGALEPEGYSIKRISPAFKMRYVVPLEIKMEGVSGIGFTDGVSNFSALLNTSTLTEPTIAANEIKIFGKQITGAFVNDCGGADDWNGTAENKKDTAAAVTLVGCGVNYVSFQTGVAPV